MERWGESKELRREGRTDVPSPVYSQLSYSTPYRTGTQEPKRLLRQLYFQLRRFSRLSLCCRRHRLTERQLEAAGVVSSIFLNNNSICSIRHYDHHPPFSKVGKHNKAFVMP